VPEREEAAWYYVYIMASGSGTLYTGVTNDVYERTLQHKSGEHPGFTQKYGCNRLVYYEAFRYVRSAIRRETEIKGWVRRKKIGIPQETYPRIPVSTWDARQCVASDCWISSSIRHTHLKRGICRCIVLVVGQMWRVVTS
jgi:putative endonuclease